jgi:hypothetical protein
MRRQYHKVCATYFSTRIRAWRWRRRLLDNSSPRSRFPAFFAMLGIVDTTRLAQCGGGSLAFSPNVRMDVRIGSMRPKTRFPSLRPLLYRTASSRGRIVRGLLTETTREDRTTVPGRILSSSVNMPEINLRCLVPRMPSINRTSSFHHLRHVLSRSGDLHICMHTGLIAKTRF